MFDRTNIPDIPVRLQCHALLATGLFRSNYGREDNFRVLYSGSSFLSSLPGAHFCYSGVLTEDGYTRQAFRIV